MKCHSVFAALAVLSLMSSSLLAQEASVTLAPYALLGGAEFAQQSMEFRVNGNSLATQLYGKPRSPQIPATGSTAFSAHRADGSELATTNAIVETNRQYLLLLSGDGERAPFQLQLIDRTPATTTVRTLSVANTALLQGDDPSAELRTELECCVGPDAETADARHAQLADVELPIFGSGDNIRVRASSSGVTLVDPTTTNPISPGHRFKPLAIINGDQRHGALEVDYVFSATQTFRYSMWKLDLGPVELWMLHGASYFPGDHYYFGVGELRTNDSPWGTLIGPFSASEGGLMNAFVSPLGLADAESFGSFEFHGNRRYLVVARTAELGRDEFSYLELPGTDGAAQATIYFEHAGPDPALEDARLRNEDGSVVAPVREYGQSAGISSATGISADLKLTDASGKRNILDLAPLEVLAGDQAVGVVIGNGRNYPFTMVAVSGQVQAENTVDNAVSALWTTVDRPNQGFSLSAIPEQDRLVGSWFSYSTDGSERTWFILDSCGSPAGVGECTHPYAFDNQSADLTVYTAEGGTFGGAQAAIEVAGTMHIDFDSCLSARVSYDLIVEGQGEFQIANLNPGVECSAP